MERNKHYQREDVIFDLVVWVSVIVVMYLDITGTL